MNTKIIQFLTDGLPADQRTRQEYKPILKQLGNPVSSMRIAMLGFRDGDVDKACMACGQVCGRVNDIPTCKELVERIVAEAEEQIEIVRRKIVA